MDYRELSKEELEKLREKVREELEELEEERLFVLSQTGIHLSGGERKRYEAEVEALRKKLAAIEEALKEKQ